MATTGLQKQFASITHALLEAWNNRDFEQINALATEDIEWLNVPSGTLSHGRDGFRHYVQVWLTAMPDNRVEILNTIVAGNWEVVEAVGRAAHTGPLAGPIGQAPPTGRPVELRFCMVNHIRAGQIDRGAVYLDMSPMVSAQ